jgi:geranylgeranyl pyrophosphate synthase
MRLLGDDAISLEARELKHWYCQVLEDNTEKIAAVKEIFERLGVRPLCELVVDDYTNKALELLNQLPQNAATEQLRQLANKLTTRKD